MDKVSQRDNQDEESSRSQADSYLKLMKEELQSKQPEGRFEKLNQLQITKGNRILDLGCGDGTMTVLLAEKVGPEGHVTGVDPDKERIKVAKETHKYPNIDFFVGDDQRFPEDKLYDVIFSSYVLHWIKDKKAAFQKITKYVRPGGQFIIIVPIGGQAIADEMTQLMESKGKESIKANNIVPAKTYSQLAEENGFQTTLFDKGFDITNYPTPESLLDAWMAITHGAFNPERADQVGLAKFKEKYNGKPIEWKVPVLRCILTKM